ncbi:MAG: sugar phosphate isomerase/epimerase [Pirellulaceae bacterium]
MPCTISRRHAIALTTTAATSGILAPWLLAADEDPAPHIATNTYPWQTFARRAGESHERHTETMLRNIASTGIDGYEPIVDSPDELDGLGNRLAVHGLQMRSIYVNSVLHDESKVDESIVRVVAIAKAVRELGTRIIVTNPSPIRWGGDEDKDDSQLRHQAKSLDELGSEVRKLDITLAYHNHDAELRNGAREFHHMLTATRSENVKFCLDSHWIFRGCGDSEVAVMDALKHYKDRIVELHLRQSAGGIWTEAFAMQGDIDYQKIFKRLAADEIRPHMVLEQAVEQKSPNTLSATQAHRQSQQSLVRAI